MFAERSGAVKEGSKISGGPLMKSSIPINHDAVPSRERKPDALLVVLSSLRSWKGEGHAGAVYIGLCT